MATMDGVYGDGSDHDICDKCGFCIECGDCEKHGCGKGCGSEVDDEKS